MTPVKKGRELAAAIKNSQLVEIAGAGHMLPSESPDAVNAALLSFWVRRNRPSLTGQLSVFTSINSEGVRCLLTEFFKDCRDRCWYDGQRYCCPDCQCRLAGIALDLPARAGQEHNPAEQAIQRLLKSEPPQFMHPSIADKITTGDMEADFDQLAECDLIIEAVIEQLPVKQALYKRLYQTISPDCVVTSNTSTIPISLLTADMPSDFCARFAITHYFNPVRYMRLLELVSGAETRTDILDRLALFNDQVLGKGVRALLGHARISGQPCGGVCLAGWLA